MRGLVAFSRPDISIIVPCYNECGNFEPLIDEMRAVLDNLGGSYEIIYVDDGSTDASLAELQDLQRKHPCLRVISHRSNAGQSASFLTGLKYARGNVIVTMDGDLQSDPADIPAMLKKLEHCDMVTGVRVGRKDTLSKRLSSRIANGVRRAILDDGIHDAGCTYRAIRRQALEELPAFKAIHRFAPTILKKRGFRVEEMPVRHRARIHGVSKYGIGNRLWVGIRDMFGVRWYCSRTFTPDRGVEIVMNGETDLEQGQETGETK